MNAQAWDKLLLIAVGVVIIGLSGWFVTKALAFKDQFPVPSAKPGDELPDTKTAQTQIATGFVERTNDWTLPTRATGGVPLPLFVSIPIVEIDGDLINMLDANARKIRPPASNAWLLSNNLDFLNKTVLEQDPDGDGYTNMEEWNGKTDPKSADSHPPYAEKLVLVQRRSQIYRVKFAARPDQERFQIQRLRSGRWPRQETFYLKIGDISPDDQLRLDSFEEKNAVNRVGIRVDASILNATFLPTGTKHELVRDIIEDIPTYFAELEFQLEPGRTFFVKEGDTFPLARDPNAKYRLLEVKENEATVEYEPASGEKQTVVIKKK